MTQRKPRSRAKYYFASAFREAGHAVAAWNQGVMLTPVSIFPNGPGAGKNVWNDALRNVDFDWVRNADSTALAERLAVVLMSGPAAQRVFLPASPRGDICRKRLEQAQKLLDAAAGNKTAGQNRYRRMDRELERFFRRSDVREAVTALAQTLLLEGTVSGDEAESLVERSSRKNPARSRIRRR